MLSILLHLASFAHASTYYLSDIGVRGYARGGAFVAGANDLSAQWYNPSALTRLHGTEVQLHTTGVKQFINFDREDYPGQGPVVDGNPTDLINAPIENTARLLPIPHFGVIHDFGIENLTVLFGFTTPYATGMKYSADGPQRYSLQDSVVIHTFTGPAIAYKIHELVSIGLGSSWNYLVVGQTRKVALQVPNTICDGSTENPQCDVQFEATTKDKTAFTWNASTTIESPNHKWAWAVMYQPKIKVDAVGSLHADFTGNFFYDNGIVLSQTTEDKEVNLVAYMPKIIRTGILFRPSEFLELELSGVYEGWKTLQSLDITNVNMKIDLNDFFGDTTITDDISLPTHFNDSWSLRFGGEYRKSDRWTMRSGVMYETTGLQNEYMNPGLVDRNKFGLGMGASWHANEKWTIDGGAFGSWMGTWDVTNSQSKQIAVLVDPFSDEGAKVIDGRTVSDGTYSSSNILLGLGFSRRFLKE